MSEQSSRRDTLVLGGVRSGKSRYAQQLVARGERVAFIATAEACDDDMRQRIERHRSNRSSHWTTFEAPLALEDTPLLPASAGGGVMTKFARALPLLLFLASYAWATRMERDETGRSVMVPDQVHRVVSLSPSLTDTVYALGAAGDLVGITDYTGYPREAKLQKPSVGSVVNPSLERIVALHPDLVLALPDFNGAETIAGLQRLGIPVFLFNTGDIDNIYRSVESVGRLMGRERQARALVAELRAREAKVRAQAAGTNRPAVVLVLSIDPLITAGKHAFITQMITAAGARSVTEDIKQDWLQMNVEAILPRKPDYILLMKGGPVSLKDMQSSPGWKSLQAVQRGRVILLDDRIQIPAPVAFDGLEDFAKQIQLLQSH